MPCLQVFLEIPYGAVSEKNLDVIVFPLLTNMFYKTAAQIKYEMIGIVIVLIMLIKL